jgi:hypothetical protein
MQATEHNDLYGLLGEFDNPTAVVEGARSAYERGYRRLDAFSPYPIHELSDAIGFRRTALPLIVLASGIVGGLSGFGLQYWVSAVAYPLNIGGRPLNSWPAFIPVTFELTILFAALAAVFGMLALNGLPRPHHPLFNAENFKLASRDRFFVCIESSDPIFDLVETRRFLEEHGASVSEVRDE